MTPAPGAAGKMDIVYVCKAVDETNRTLAHQVRWIRRLAAHERVDRVRVLTPGRGPASLPSNVTVHVFGATGPWALARTMARFQSTMATAGRGASLYFVSQGGPYPALLLPWKLVLGTPLFQWKAMPQISPRMRFYARVCDDLVFTATRGSFPLASAKVIVVGHGIDTELFRPLPGALPSRDLVAVTRIAPIKRLDEVLRAVAECGRRTGRTPSLDIIGPCDSKSQHHLRELHRLVAELGLDADVRILAAVDQAELPALLGGYRAAVNFADTGFDKAAGEAMACGLPLVTTNPRVIEALPEDLRSRLAAPAGDTVAQASLIAAVLAGSDIEREAIGRRLRDLVVRQHSLDALFGKIIVEIDTWNAARGRRGRRLGSLIRR